MKEEKSNQTLGIIALIVAIVVYFLK